MTGIRVLNPAQLGPPVAPGSQAVIANGFVHVAGQIALDAGNRVVAPGDARAQTAYTLGRLGAILAEVDAHLGHVVSATVFLAARDDFGPFNEAWTAAFGDHRPARATVIAGLMLTGLLVEIQAIAALPG